MMIDPRFHEAVFDLPEGVVPVFMDHDKRFVRAVRKAVDILRPRDASNPLSRYVDVRLDPEAYVLVLASGCSVAVVISETERAPGLIINFGCVDGGLDEGFPELIDRAGRHPHAEIQGFAPGLLKKALKALMLRCVVRMLPELLAAAVRVH